MLFYNRVLFQGIGIGWTSKNNNPVIKYTEEKNKHIIKRNTVFITKKNGK